MGRKFYGHKTFTIAPGLSVTCKAQRTNYGFRHLATAFLSGAGNAHSKACYYNRTWERYEYQTVIRNAVNQLKLPDELKAQADKWIETGDGSDMAMLHMVAGFAKLGELLCSKPEEKNAWKKRMLIAGLGNKGIDFPADFDSLTEAEKTLRLDSAIEALRR